MAFWHLFLGLLISAISLIASIIFLTTTTSDRLRYFCVAWTTVSAAVVWILVCVSACLWSRRCEGAMKEEPRKERIGRTIFEVCWPNGSQGSFHSYYRDRPQPKAPGTPRISSRICHFSWTSFADMFAAPAKGTNTAPPVPTPSGLESGKPKHNRTSSQVPLPPSIYSQSRNTRTESDSFASDRSANSRTALIYPDSHGFFHDPSLIKPHLPEPPTKHPWCGCGPASQSQLLAKEPSLIYPDSNGIYLSPNQLPNVSPLSQSPMNRHSAVSALSLDIDISNAKLETASVMRATRPRTVDVTPPKSTRSNSVGGAKCGAVVVDEGGSPRKVVSSVCAVAICG